MRPSDNLFDTLDRVSESLLAGRQVLPHFASATIRLETFFLLST